MTVYLASDEGFDFTPLFVFDCVETSEIESGVTWTEYPVESGAVISDFAARRPTTFRVAGIITATPESGLDVTRPGAIFEALQALVADRAELWLSSPDYLALVVLDSCRAVVAVEDGEALRVEIAAHTIERTQWEYTEIPLDLLSPPLRGGVETPPGTADAVNEEPPVRKSVAARIADGEYGGLI
jgi:hypothetical protein